MPDLTARYEFATDLVKDAGELALDYFHRLGTLTIKQKGEQDMASEADLNVEMLIRDRLRNRFPEDAFLGEETGRTEFSAGQGVWGWLILSMAPSPSLTVLPDGVCRSRSY